MQRILGSLGRWLRRHTFPQPAFLRVEAIVRHEPVDMLADLPRADKARALELTLRILMARTPGEIRMYEFLAAVRPAAVAHVEVDDPVRCTELLRPRPARPARSTVR